MAIAITVNSRFPRGLFSGSIIKVYGTLAFSGSYATNGDALDFGPVVGFSNKQPLNVDITGIAGFYYEYDYVAKKLRVRTGAAAQTALTELTAGAYPAGV